MRDLEGKPARFNAAGIALSADNAHLYLSCGPLGISPSGATFR